VEHFDRGRLERRELVKLLPTQLGIAPDAAFARDLPHLGDPTGDHRRSLAGLTVEQGPRRWPIDMDHDVESIEQRTGHAGCVARTRRRIAATIDRATLAAGTRVHRGDQQQPGGMLPRAPRPSDAHHTLLERLSQRVEHARGKLAQLVEEQHTLARDADLARARLPGPAADQGGHRGRVMRRAKRWAPDQRRGRQREPGGAVDPRDLARCAATKVGK
jgi:hypothetical protein